MGLTSLQVCMDSSDWLQGTMDEENGMDSSSSPSGDILTCSRPLIERRLRPQHDQALKCPRCDSTHTKFCYYNNYSLSQPRYFCKTCRRYWTKGGTLRNIPVGGGCRKNKKVSSKKSPSSSNDHDHQSNNNIIINQNPGGSSSTSHHNPTDLQLSTTFPVADMQFSHLGDLMGNHHHHHHHGGGGALGNPNFMDSKYINAMLENPRPIDFMESNKYHKFIGNGELGYMSGLGHDMMGPNFHGLCSPFGMSLDHGNSNGPSFMDMSSTQRLMLPYEATMGDHHHHHQGQNMTMDVKPNPKLLSLDQWQDQQACSDAAGKDPSSSFGYFTGLGPWTSGLMNGYGSSTTNPLV